MPPPLTPLHELEQTLAAAPHVGGPREEDVELLARRPLPLVDERLKQVDDSVTYLFHGLLFGRIVSSPRGGRQQQEGAAPCGRPMISQRHSNRSPAGANSLISPRNAYRVKSLPWAAAVGEH